MENIILVTKELNCISYKGEFSFITLSLTLYNLTVCIHTFASTCMSFLVCSVPTRG